MEVDKDDDAPIDANYYEIDYEALMELYKRSKWFALILGLPSIPCGVGLGLCVVFLAMWAKEGDTEQRIRNTGVATTDQGVLLDTTENSVRTTTTYPFHRIKTVELLHPLIGSMETVELVFKSRTVKSVRIEGLKQPSEFVDYVKNQMEQAQNSKEATKEPV